MAEMEVRMVPEGPQFTRERLALLKTHSYSGVFFDHPGPNNGVLGKAIAYAPGAVVKLVPQNRQGELGEPYFFVEKDAAKIISRVSGPVLNLISMLSKNPLPTEQLSGPLSACGVGEYRDPSSVRHAVHEIAKAGEGQGIGKLIVPVPVGMGRQLRVVPHYVSGPLHLPRADALEIIGGHSRNFVSYLEKNGPQPAEDLRVGLGLPRCATKHADRVVMLGRTIIKLSTVIDGAPLIREWRITPGSMASKRMYAYEGGNGKPASAEIGGNGKFELTRHGYSPAHAKLIEDVGERQGVLPMGLVREKSEGQSRLGYSTVMAHLNAIRRIEPSIPGFYGPALLEGLERYDGHTIILNPLLAKLMGKPVPKDPVRLLLPAGCLEFLGPYRRGVIGRGREHLRGHSPKRIRQFLDIVERVEFMLAPYAEHFTAKLVSLPRVPQTNDEAAAILRRWVFSEQLSADVLQQRMERIYSAICPRPGSRRQQEATAVLHRFHDGARLFLLRNRKSAQTRPQAGKESGQDLSAGVSVLERFVSQSSSR